MKVTKDKKRKWKTLKNPNKDSFAVESFFKDVFRYAKHQESGSEYRLTRNRRSDDIVLSQAFALDVQLELMELLLMQQRKQWKKLKLPN